MISLAEVEHIHPVLIENFGGASGVRDYSALDAAIHRPFATFDQQELYPDAASKAVAILESILINHPFLDGNKRTGYVLMRLFLLQAGQDLQATQDEKYDLVISVATGEVGFAEIKEWIEKRSVSQF